MKTVVIVVAVLLALELGGAMLAHAQPNGGCEGIAPPEAAAECRARQRIFRNLDAFVDGVANRIAQFGIAAFDASIQSAGQELAGRASVTIGNVEAALQSGSAQGEVLLAATRGLLGETDRVLADTDAVLNEGNQVVNDAEEVLDDAEDVLDESKDTLERTNDLLKRLEPLLVRGEQAEQALRGRITQTEARVAAVVARLRSLR